METTVSSSPSIEVVLAWWVERLPMPAFAGLAGFVAVAGLVGADGTAEFVPAGAGGTMSPSNCRAITIL